MKKIFFTSLIIIAAAVIVTAFFMPWASVSTSVMGISKKVTSEAEKVGVPKKIVEELDEITDTISDFGDIKLKTTVRGIDIPVMVNRKTSKVAISAAQILLRDAKNLGPKSYLVYLVPFLGLLSAALAVFGLKNKVYIFLMLAISGALSIGGLYNLKTMHTANTVVKVSIRTGLWYTVYAFLFIFLAGAAWLILDKKK